MHILVTLDITTGKRIVRELDVPLTLKEFAFDYCKDHYDPNTELFLMLQGAGYIYKECPKCKMKLLHPSRNSVSRVNGEKVCNACGTEEAYEAYAKAFVPSVVVETTVTNRKVKRVRRK